MVINSFFKLFRVPNDLEFIICAADPGGEYGDPNRAVWKSKGRMDTIMNFSAWMEGTQFAFELVKGCKLVFLKTGIWPVIMVERNTGGAVISKLVELNYPNLYRMEEFDEPTKQRVMKIGWHTNTFTRPKLLDDLALSIRQCENIIPDIDEIKEFKTFVRNQRTGKPEAEGGMHDDYVIAEGIAWQGVLTVDTPVFDDANVGEAPEWVIHQPTWGSGRR